MRNWQRRRSKWHRWPRYNESVIDYEREDRGPYGRGRIIHVSKDAKQVMVSFYAPPEASKPKYILVYGEDALWDARVDPSACFHQEVSYVDVNEQQQSAVVDQLITTQYFDFDDLRWSSHEGGVGAWTTRRYNP